MSIGGSHGLRRTGPAPRYVPAKSMSQFDDLSERARAVFAQVVEEFLASGEPVGSKSLSQLPGGLGLSPASIRSVLHDLEAAGLLASPHTSAGRLPTDTGLRLFVDGMVEFAAPGAAERAAIEAELGAGEADTEMLLDRVGGVLSGLAGCAAVVTVPRAEMIIAQVAFAPLSERRALAILIGRDGSVENRLVESETPLDIARLEEAANYMTERLAGLTLAEAAERLRSEIASERAALGRAAKRIVEQGLAVWSRDEPGRAVLIVKGQAHLLEDAAAADLDRVRRLLEDIDGKEDLLGVLDMAREARAMKIFIGSENKLYSLTGSSVIAAPYEAREGRMVGVVGVIGPTRLDYARIIPMVDYTAQTVSRLIG